MRRSSSSGRSPGRISTSPPALAAGQHAAGERRQQPARSTDDLPLPDGPTMPRKRGADEAGDELGDQSLAAEEVVGIGGLEARQALERAHTLGGEAGSAWAWRERARACSRASCRSITLPASSASTSLRSLRPAAARDGDVGEQPARLVDRDRQRRPGELAAARVALLGLLRQRPGDHRVERRRQLRPPLARRRRLLVEVREHDRDVSCRAGTAARPTRHS